MALTRWWERRRGDLRALSAELEAVGTDARRVLTRYTLDIFMALFLLGWGVALAVLLAGVTP